MAYVKILVGLAVSFFSSASFSQVNCVGNKPIEISGKVRASGKLVWNDIVVPNRFILKPSQKGVIEKGHAEKLARDYNLIGTGEIKEASVDDSSRIIIVYFTDHGYIIMEKILASLSGGGICIPSNSINYYINKMPASVNYARGADGTKDCSWYAQVLDTKKYISYGFYRPSLCVDKPSSEDAKGFTQAIAKLIS